MSTLPKKKKRVPCSTCRLLDKKGKLVQQPIPPARIDVTKI